MFATEQSLHSRVSTIESGRSSNGPDPDEARSAFQAVRDKPKGTIAHRVVGAGARRYARRATSRRRASRQRSSRGGGLLEYAQDARALALTLGGRDTHFALLPGPLGPAHSHTILAFVSLAREWKYRSAVVNQSKVIAVHGELFFTRASPWQNVAGYRYTAECEDLSSEVILSDTFVRYDRAYQWRKLIRGEC